MDKPNTATSTVSRESALAHRRSLRAEFYALPPEALIDRDTTAAVRYVERQSLELEAIKGGGIPYRRIGRRVFYRKADVLAWMESQSAIIHNTAQVQA